MGEKLDLHFQKEISDLARQQNKCLSLSFRLCCCINKITHQSCFTNKEEEDDEDDDKERKGEGE